MTMERLEKIFGNTAYVKIILLFYNSSYFDNMTGIANAVNLSHVTVRKVVSDLIEAGILSETKSEKSRVIMINENSPYSEALFNFITIINSVHSIDGKKGIGEIIEKRYEIYRRKEE
ncbi:unnamed protein product [marine sediment metagenome]|uniref:Uncharacterized protein n=1 Tax=marine sediment metagenome TaxID=412755 RepID=X1KDB0_9ZZZZ